MGWVGDIGSWADQAMDETPDLTGAFPRLSDRQIEILSRHGERRPTERGDVLFHSGEPCPNFFVILGGKVAVLDQADEEPRVIRVHGPRRFLGELGLLTGQPSFLTTVVYQPGEVLAIPVERLREILTHEPEIGDLILRAYVIRRFMLIDSSLGFRIIGSRYSPDFRRLREFAARNRLPHRWIDLEQDASAESLLRRLGVTPEETPIVVAGMNVLHNPSNAELARVVGLPVPVAPPDVVDMVVVGAGPAGLAAAVYAASEGLATVALDAIAAGGQAATSSRIENYLGFPSGISGGELAERAVIQATKFGARLGVPAEVYGLGREEGYYRLDLRDADPIVTRSVVISTGARYRRLNVPRLELFEGTSVFYAATASEAMVCRGDPVVVVGGGNSAGQATLFLAEHAARVTLAARGGDLSADMSRYLVDQIERAERVEVRLFTEVRELLGEDTLEGVVVEDMREGRRTTIEARALFVFIGAVPHTGWLKNTIALDQDGFVLTGSDIRTDSNGQPPNPLETNWPGVFAAGDVRSGSIKRVASAVGEGAMAVQLVHRRLG